MTSLKKIIPIEISNNFNEAISKRYKKYFRFNNSNYWRQYYKPKIAKADTSREKLYASILKRYVPKNGLIIDIGSGYGFLAKEIYKAGLRIECVDLFDEMIAEAKKYLKGTNINIIKADILNTPFEKSSLDCITVESVIEHFPISEVENDILPYFSRLIKKDGFLFVHVPVKSLTSEIARFFRKNIQKDLPYWAIDDDGDVTHKIWITYKDYIKMIERHGFKVVNFDFRTTRSNMKPKIFYSLMHNIQKILRDSDEEFLVTINEENSVKYLKKIAKSNFALTSYLLFRKV